jgi:putative DNA primase/helicase
VSAPWEEAQRTADDIRDHVNGSSPAISLRAVPGSMTAIRRTRWAWQGWAPLGCFLLVAGEPGQGKGVLTCSLIAGLTRGTTPGDLQGTPVSALWIGLEDSWEEVVLPRLAAAGADVERVFHLVVDTPGQVLDVARDQRALAELVAGHDIRVIAFEAIVDHLAGVDDHKNAEVRRGLAPLVELARSHQLVAVGTTHLTKATAGSFRQRVAGSGGYLAVARVGLLVHRHPDNPDQRVLALGKGNLGQVPDSIVFEIEGVDVINPEDPDEVADVGVLARPYADSSLTVEELLAGSRVDQGSLRNDVVDFLQEFLADGRRRATDVFEQAADEGLTAAALKRHKRAAGARSRREGDIWWWELKGIEDE